MLTIDKLKKMDADYTFKFGYTNGALWVAKRGVIHDWAIYEKPCTIEQIERYGFDAIIELCQRLGYKLYDKTLIKAYVPCDDEAYEMYRL